MQVLVSDRDIEIAARSRSACGDKFLIPSYVDEAYVRRENIILRGIACGCIARLAQVQLGSQHSKSVVVGEVRMWRHEYTWPYKWIPR